MDAPGDRLAAVVLAAGLGTRLRPLTFERPKALCPVGGIALLDLAVDRVRLVTPSIAVNVHHERVAMEHHLAVGCGARRNVPVAVSVEAERPLGTAGALGHLRSWIDGRAVLVVNGDAWCTADLASFVAAWDGDSIGVLVHGAPEFHAGSAVAGALMPWSDVARLVPEPSGLYEVSWRAAHDAGRLTAIRYDGPFVDCGTPGDYLAANLLANGGASVVGAGAAVDGEVVESVVWEGARVGAGERLRRAIRTTHGRTVLVR